MIMEEGLVFDFVSIAIQQVPALVVLVVVVWVFLRHIEAESKTRHDESRALREVVNRNTEALASNIQLLGEVKALMHNLSERLSHVERKV